MERSVPDQPLLYSVGAIGGPDIKFDFVPGDRMLHQIEQGVAEGDRRVLSNVGMGSPQCLQTQADIQDRILLHT